MKTLIVAGCLIFVALGSAYGQSWLIQDPEGYKSVTKGLNDSYTVFDSNKGYTGRISETPSGSFNLWDSGKGYQGRVSNPDIFKYLNKSDGYLQRYINSPLRRFDED